MAEASGDAAPARPGGEGRYALVDAQAADLARGEAIADASSTAATGVTAVATVAGGTVAIGAAAAGWAGGKLGAGLADWVDADEKVAAAAEFFGASRIGQVGPEGPHPATVGHQVAHSYALAGFLATVALGIAAGVVVGALVVASGGTALAVIAGAAAAGGVGGFAGGALQGLSQVGSRTGPIVTGSPDTFIERREAARMTDTAACAKESAPTPIVEGSETIYINGLPLARNGHKLLCGAVIDEGAASVFVDSTTQACATPGSEVPWWARVAADWVGFLPWGKASSALAKKFNTSRSNVSAGLPSSKTTTCRDPVDVASGAFVEWRTDALVPGVLAFSLRRHYASGRADPPSLGAPSLFGPRWRDSLSVRLVRRDDQGRPLIDYHDDEGVTWTFDVPFESLDARHLRVPHLALEGTRAAPVLVDRELGTRSHFAWGLHGPDDAARLTRVTDAWGNELRVVYDDDGRVVRVAHSDGYDVTFAWASDDGGPARLRGLCLVEPGAPSVELARYGFDADGRLSECASDTCGRLYYRYDEAHRMVAWGDGADTHVGVVYGDDGRVAALQTPMGLHDGRFVYDTNARATDVWVGPSRTRYEYDADGLVTRVTDALDHQTLTAWDRQHRRTAETDALGRTTRYSYTDEGLLAAVIDPAGRVAAYGYDDEGRRVRARELDGATWSWRYDAAGALVSARSPDGLETRYTYDARGRTVARVDPGGLRSTFHHDDRGVPCGVTGPDGAQERWTQDRLGRVTDATDPLGATTHYSYDPLPGEAPAATWPVAGGHTAPRRVTLPNGDVLRYERDAEGRLTRSTDAAGASRSYRWGPFDVLLARRDALGHEVSFSYDADERVTAVTNAAGEAWRYTYDAAGRLVEESDFAGRVTRYHRDAAGRLVAKTLPDGSAHTYRWRDDDDALLGIDAGARRIAYERDAAGRITRAAVLRGEAVESETRLTWDARGRLVEERQACGDDARTIAWTYDALGQLIARGGDGGVVRYRRDPFGRLTELRVPEGAVCFERDLLGRDVSRASRPDAPRGGYSLRQRFDVLGRLTAQHLGDERDDEMWRVDALDPADPRAARTVRRRFHWDRGRLVGVDDARFGATRYRFDPREQVVEASYGPLPGAAARGGARAKGAEEVDRFGYDVASNLAAVGSRGEEVALTHGPGGSVRRRGRRRFTYDARGRVTSWVDEAPGFRPKAWHLRWDEFDRLTGVTTPDDARWSYTYDAFGRRVARRCVSAGRASRGDAPRLLDARYLWDGAALAREWRAYADGTPAHEESIAWLPEPGEFTPVAAVRARGDEARGEFFHVVCDHLGAPKELVTDAGEVVWAAQHRAWGQVRHQWARSRGANDGPFTGWDRSATNESGFEVNLRFANQFEDDETGLFYNFQRYYDPETASYLSQDPIGLAGGLRPQGYVDDPTGWIDPLGLNVCPALYAKYKANRAKGMTAAEAHAAATSHRTPKRVPNPNGKKGGPQHQAQVDKVVAEVESRNLVADREHRVMTPNGTKGSRYVDVVGKDRSGKVVEMHQVGKQTQGGAPVARERRALDDIEGATGTRPQFHPYN